jgi:hypothetical protein
MLDVTRLHRVEQTSKHSRRPVDPPQCRRINTSIRRPLAVQSLPGCRRPIADLLAFIRGCSTLGSDADVAFMSERSLLRADNHAFPCKSVITSSSLLCTCHHRCLCFPRLRPCWGKEVALLEQLFMYCTSSTREEGIRVQRLDFSG